MGALVFLALCLDLGEMDRAQSLHARSFRGVENQTFSASQLPQAADSTKHLSAPPSLVGAASCRHWAGGGREWVVPSGQVHLWLDHLPSGMPRCQQGYLGPHSIVGVR